jgi:hypothetical protein
MYGVTGKTSRSAPASHVKDQDRHQHVKDQDPLHYQYVRRHTINSIKSLALTVKDQDRLKRWSQPPPPPLRQIASPVDS